MQATIQNIVRRTDISATDHNYEDGLCTVCGAEDPNVVTLGDVNGDGRINVADYMLVKRSVLRTYTLNEEQKSSADVNGDGRINIADYTLLKRFVMGTIEKLG